MMQAICATLRTHWGFCAVLWALCAGPAAGTTVDDLCDASADPCVVTGTHLIDAGSLLNAGTRALRVEGRLDVAGGAMTLRAGTLTVTGELRAMGSSSNPGGTINAAARVIQIDGTIDARGGPGGTVMLSATQNLEIDGSVTVTSRSGDFRGGTIAVMGDTIAVAGALAARGGNDSSGGDVTIIARADLACGGSIDTSGGDGGNIELVAATARSASLTLSSTAMLRTDATFNGCDGGNIDLTAGGVSVPGAGVVVEGQLISNGRSGNEEDGGGSGGALTISATGDVVLMGSAARLTATGASPDGSGGDVTLSAGGAVTVRGPIDVDADGNDSSGGSLSVEAGDAVELEADVSATGDSGGEIVMRSDATLSVDATLRSDGSRDGGGGSVELRACSLNIATDGVLSSLGSQGSNVLIGLDVIVIAGDLRADSDSGRNELRFPSAADPPVLAGASIQPPAEQIVDPSLGPCGGPVATATPTATATSAATRTPSATRPPRRTPGEPCIGDCNNNDRVTIDELVELVGSALAGSDPAGCAAGDHDGNHRITVDELVAAVISGLTDCR